MFYDGPPTANGKPHIGHVTRVIMIWIPRYHTMKGEKVPRKAGWDTHGLPVELEVGKRAPDLTERIRSRSTVLPFIKMQGLVWKYEGMWRNFGYCRFLGGYGQPVCHFTMMIISNPRGGH